MQTVDPHRAPIMMRLAPGPHTIALRPVNLPIDLYSFSVEQRQAMPSPEKKTVHYRLFTMEPGEGPPEKRRSAQRLIKRVCA
jgi:hypothetical protein